MSGGRERLARSASLFRHQRRLSSAKAVRASYPSTGEPIGGLISTGALPRRRPAPCAPATHDKMQARAISGLLGVLSDIRVDALSAGVGLTAHGRQPSITRSGLVSKLSALVRG